MDPQDAVDLGREALLMATLIAAPVLLSGMIVGLAVGLIQALTQVQEQTGLGLRPALDIGTPD